MSEDGLNLPPNATLSSSCAWSLQTGKASISLSKATANRPNARCIIVGRHVKSVDVRVDHGSISRRHAAIYFLEKEGDRCVLQDLESKKGVLVNGALVAKGAQKDLQAGDEIIFGHARERVFRVVVSTSNSSRTIDDSVTSSAVETATTAEAEATNTEERNIEQTIKQHRLPVRERMNLTAESERRHRVTCMALDSSGNRLVVGTTDGTLRFYDFGGMDRLQRGPFKMIQVEEGQKVSDVCFSNTGDRIIVGTGGSQPSILDRDGGEIIKFVRGDMYVVDKSKTLGHTATVTGVQWHPLQRDIVLTSSEDCSVRLWNLNGKTQFQMLVCDKVFQPKSQKGQRTSVLSLAFHPGGREFAVGTSCGSIQIWNTSRVSGRPDRAVYDAHGTSERPVDAIVYSPDGSRLSSRSIDDTQTLVWDASKLSKSSSPIVRCNATPTLFAAQCRPAFSPDGLLLCVGISELIKKGEGRESTEAGSVKFFQLPPRRSLSSSVSSSSDTTPTLDAILELPIFTAGAGVADVLWHNKTNQLFLGCTDGKVEILFDPDLSERGALLPFAKAGKQKETLSELLKSRAPVGSAALAARSQIIAPNAIAHKRKRDKDLDDPAETLKPQAPGAKFRMGRLNG